MNGRAQCYVVPTVSTWNDWLEVVDGVDTKFRPTLCHKPRQEGSGLWQVPSVSNDHALYFVFGVTGIGQREGLKTEPTQSAMVWREQEGSDRRQMRMIVLYRRCRVDQAAVER